MTTVYYDDRNLILTAKGHAGYAKNKEPDIVCSAVSMLLFTLAENLLKLPETTQKIPPKIRFDSGDVKISFYAHREYYKEVKKMFDFILTGFRLLEHRYPENIKVKEI